MNAKITVGDKLCPFLPWVPVKSTLDPRAGAQLSPMACQQTNCAIYNDEAKCCALRMLVNINLGKQEVKVG